jgi:hypothetical protein
MPIFDAAYQRERIAHYEEKLAKQPNRQILQRSLDKHWAKLAALEVSPLRHP